MEKDKLEKQQKPKSERSDWGNYFKDFLMLFLAVFCGLLTEDFREGQQEKVRKRNESEGLTINPFISPFNSLHSDPDWILGMAQYDGTVFDTLQIYERSPIYKPFHLVKTAEIDRLETYNRLGANLIAFASTRKLTYRQYQKVNADLLKRLREGYRI